MGKKFDHELFKVMQESEKTKEADWEELKKKLGHAGAGEEGFIERGGLWEARAVAAEKQLKERESAIWVKASERLPEQTKKTRLYIVKWFDIQMCVRTWTANKLADWVKNTPTLEYFWLDEGRANP